MEISYEDALYSIVTKSDLDLCEIICKEVGLQKSHESELDNIMVTLCSHFFHLAQGSAASFVLTDELDFSPSFSQTLSLVFSE